MFLIQLLVSEPPFRARLKAAILVRGIVHHKVDKSNSVMRRLNLNPYQSLRLRQTDKYWQWKPVPVSLPVLILNSAMYWIY